VVLWGSGEKSGIMGCGENIVVIKINKYFAMEDE
jgi:hypothetical protein